MASLQCESVETESDGAPDEFVVPQAVFTIPHLELAVIEGDQAHILTKRHREAHLRPEGVLSMSLCLDILEKSSH